MAGTEEIENAILLDRDREGSPVLNAAVVGMKDAMLGTAPCAFIILRAGASLTSMDEGKLCALVQGKLGGHAVPGRFVVCTALPETYSGKYMRRILRSMVRSPPYLHWPRGMPSPPYHHWPHGMPSSPYSPW